MKRKKHILKITLGRRRAESEAKFQQKFMPVIFKMCFLRFKINNFCVKVPKYDEIK